MSATDFTLALINESWNPRELGDRCPDCLRRPGEQHDSLCKTCGVVVKGAP